MENETRVEGRDIIITRAFDAPREVVFLFFTDPKLLASWFGPEPFTVPDDTVVVEPRAGGRWALAMEDPETHDRFPLTGEILEIVEPELIVMTMRSETGMGDIDHMTLRIQFHDHGDKTRMTLHQGPFPDQAMIEPSAIGWESSFAKIDAQLVAQ
jgi:uncharacterized protein YndB with AHSA1/START domain